MFREIEGGDVPLDVLAEADIVKQPHDFMVESYRAGLVVNLRGAIDAECGDTGFAKEVGSHGSRRAEANNDDLVVVHSHLFAFSC
ncbi:hypothetical protein J2857_006066 [Neorhizobium galegae]|nr:hypothetical protein [Neorhizobium galegae]